MKPPFYILAATPVETSKLKRFFESGEDSVISLLQSPGEIRYAGWNLQTFDTPRIIKGEYLEVRNGDRKLIKLYEDGTLILRALADNNFLGWGQDRDSFIKSPRLNPIAVVELTYSFVDFYKNIASRFLIKPNSIKFRVDLKNTFIDGAKLYLTPYGLGTYAWHFNDDKHPAPSNEMEREVEVSLDSLSESPSHVAYELVQKVYLWFGLEPKEIPYVAEDEKGRKFIDIEKIKKSS